MGNKDDGDPWPNPSDITPEVHCGLCGKVTMHERRADGGLACISCRARTQVAAEYAATAARVRMTAPLRCPRCGSINMAGSRFCAACALAFVQLAPPPELQGRSFMSAGWWWLIGCCVALAAIGMVIAGKKGPANTYTQEERCVDRGVRWYREANYETFMDGRSARSHVIEKCRRAPYAFDDMDD